MIQADKFEIIFLSWINVNFLYLEHVNGEIIYFLADLGSP